MPLQTPLYPLHLEASARMVDFAGWDMPVQYQSTIEEHHAVRQGAGMFDVSHMTAVDMRGARVSEFLRFLLASDVAKLAPGKALYSCLLKEDAGILDDLITYHMRDDWFRTVVNAGTTTKDVAWFRQHAPAFGVEIQPHRELCIVAVQGPQAREKVAALLTATEREQVMALVSFSAADLGHMFVGRTGYTGEDGFEVILPAAAAIELWRKLLAAGVAPCGLGARDTLRLEAGMNLYGLDMDEANHPLESGLGWTIAWEPKERDFIGRAALEKLRGKSPRKLVGLVLEERGVLRSHLKVRSDAGAGETTSGSYSPTMKQAIALARVPAACGARVEVQIRGKWLPARVVKYPFVRNGRILV
ncbi:MAG: glycine cleavage system aminomethyltransferase GcvT [Nevskiales bacterium]